MKRVVVRFAVRVPPSTPAGAEIFVAGSAPELGGWSAAGLPCRPDGQGVYRARAHLCPGPLEFKITRGTWETVEVRAGGRERPNRARSIRRPVCIDARVAAWRDQLYRPRGPQGTNEDLMVESTILGSARRVSVHFPPNWQPDGAELPLLVMHDGQNLFDERLAFGGVKWAVDETVDRLVRRQWIEPIVVAGVWNSADRLREYHPSRPEADRYGRFLVEELVPMLRRRYGLAAGRCGLAGSSMGGIVSAWLGIRYPDLFRRVAVLSPTLAGTLLGVGRAASGWSAAPDARWWLDLGMAESTARSRRRFRRLAAMVAARIPEDRLVVRLIPRGRHHESDWGRRMPQVLRHLYPRGTCSGSIAGLP